MEINQNVFRAYDIRGIYKEDIDEEFAYLLGQSYGSYIQKLNKKECVVGMDIRYSSKALYESLIKGILSTGVNVFALGLVTTPMVYYARILKNIPSSIQVTASHNPKDYNGFKIAFDEKDTACGEEIKDFLNFTLKKDFVKGIGTRINCNIKENYIKALQEGINLGDRKIKAIIDLGNATTTMVAKEVFATLNIETKFIFDTPDPTFPNHPADPSREENLTTLKEEVIKNHADIGIAYDGDGDRVGIVSEEGKHIPIDQIMIIIIRNIINKVKKKEFLYDIKCSKSLEDEIIKLGGTPYCFKTGASYTKREIKRKDLDFGGELSGHMFFRDRFYGIDSGIYASLRILEILSNTDKPLSSLLDGINYYYSTEEIKVKSLDASKFNVVKQIEDYCVQKNYKYLNIDGVKALFPDGWALVRASNTEPVLTVRFEALTKERLEEIKNEFLNEIEKVNK